MQISSFLTRASILAVAASAAMPALAQTTGQQDFDAQSIVVTGSKTKQAVNGIKVPETSRAKQTLTQDIIQRSQPGQTILDTINLVPGVSFQNNDAYGAAGGTLNIRGFDSSRVSLNWDGLPLNDTGNYALYSNQQLDPELISDITVSLGSTDVDSPTAAATGSSVNYVTRNPTEDFHAQVMGSFGEYSLMRVFGVVDTGVLNASGTRAFIAASKETYDNPFNNIGKLNKQQFNAKVYQPIGSNGDFVALAGHFNQNRNNFFGSAPLRTDLTQSPVNSAVRTVGTGSTNRFPTDSDEREYTVATCRTAAGVRGVADTASSCGTAYDFRYNPSDTGNARLNSRVTLTDKLVFTFDAGYQYTLANGGGTATAREGFYNAQTVTGRPAINLAGYFGGSPYFGGVDLNGDGDTLDQVTVSAPSMTQTHRIIANASLRYSISPEHTVRIGYNLDWGRHRQTGEVGTIRSDGFATEYFTGNHPLETAAGYDLQKRDRKSLAVLNQAFGEYRGQFFDRRLTITAGLRAPFFTRNLTQYCFTTAGNGNVDCSGQNPTVDAAYAAARPAAVGPQNRSIHYNKVLPSAGFVFNLTPRASIFGNYSKGMSVPGTDNLYQGFYFPQGSDAADPSPETTDNFDLGVRYTSGKIQAMVDGWYTKFHNRLASSYDEITQTTLYRNLGTVEKYGVDGSISFQPVQAISLYAFGSYLHSEIKNNVRLSGTGSCDGLSPNGLTATQLALSPCAFTAGKRESDAPKYSFGGRAQGEFGPLLVGITGKRTGPRFVNDQNLPIYQSYTSGGTTQYYQVYGNKTPAYWLVNLDARITPSKLGLRNFNERTFLQLNIYNLFDQYYVGGVSGGRTPVTTLPFAQIGAPRTISGTLSIGF